MSILRSLNIGVSGMRANGEALSVTSDNIANVNTVGYKRSRAVFQDMLGRSVGGLHNNTIPGAGARLAAVDQVWSMGPLVSTDSPTDLAISGEGFFVVQGQLQGVEGRYYTRAGQFQLDEDGRLINPGGLRLQGYSAAIDGTMGTTVGDLIIDGGTVPPNATTELVVSANLNANADPAPAWDPADPGGTSTFPTSVTVYDSLGNAHEVTVYFRKETDNTWDWHAMVDGGEVTNGVPGTPTEVADGVLTFDTSGALDTESTTTSVFDFLGAAQGQTIAFDFGDSITTDAGSGLGGTTQIGSASTTTGLVQDGFAGGSVSGITIAGDGTIIGVFSNGQQRALGQVVTATFASNVGLERGGEGLFAASADSGEPLIGPPETGGRGSVVAGALEQSNVDLGTEFVNLIAYQRAFQASSKIITTSDEMYTELVNLKR
jgi:flagellar hook protein FlgE